MSIGGYISGGLHMGLLGWLAFGADFGHTPPPIEVTPVAVISAQDFAVLVNNTAPEVSVVDAALTAPRISDDQPSVNDTTDVDPEFQTSQEAVAPDQEALPETIPTALTVPSAVQLVVPKIDPEPLILEQPTIVETSLRPAPRPNDRVAPEAVLPPPPDVDLGQVQKDETAPEPKATEQKPVEKAEAPEAADTKIVTEAEAETAETFAPTRSVRPVTRPAELTAQTVPDPEPDARPEPEEDPVAAALAAALAEAQAQVDGETAQAEAEVKLSGQDIAGLQLAVSQCWNVGALSSEALAMVIVVRMDLTPDGRPVVGSLQLVEQSEGSAVSANQAFEAARRAILICGAKGFELPSEKYDAWKTIEMVFNPENMRVK